MQGFWRTKKLFLLIPFICAAALLIAWKPIAGALVERWITNHFGGDFHADKFLWENGSLTIKNPLITKSQSAANAGKGDANHRPFFSSEQVTIFYKFLPWQRDIQLHIVLQAPKLILQEDHQRIVNKLQKLMKKNSYYTVKTHVTVLQGKVISPSNQSAIVNLDIIFANLPTGNFSIQFEGDEKSKSQLHGMMTLVENQKHASYLSFQKLNIAHLFELIKPFVPFTLQNYSLHQGALDGVFSLHSNQESPSSLNGKLILDEFIAEENTHGLILNGPKIAFTGKNTFLTVETEFAGLKGGVEIDWNSNLKVMDLHFQGNAKNILDFLPESLQKSVKSNFSEDLLSVSGSFKKSQKTSNLEGIFHISDAFKKQTQEIEIGFSLGQPSENLWQEQLHDLKTKSHLNESTLKALSSNPIKAFPSLSSHAHWINKELGTYGMALKNGWFKTSDLPLDKFVSPFLFRHEHCSLKGVADISGFFDLHGIFLEYDVKHGTLENEHFSLEISEGEDELLKGTYALDFSQKDFFGEFLIRNASYFEKNSGLLFNKSRALVYITPYKIHIQDAKTESNDVHYAGTIDIDYDNLDPNIFDVDVTLHTLDGRVAGVQQLFSHFTGQSLIKTLPLDGDITLASGEPSSLHFACRNGIVEPQILLSGKLLNGSLGCSNEDLTLNDIFLTFAYNHQKKTLFLENVQGTAALASLENFKGYTINQSSIYFHNLLENQADFDLSLACNNHELARLFGKMSSDLKNDKAIQFHFDKERSHLIGALPSQLDLALAPCGRMQQLELKLMLEFKNVHDFFKRLHETPEFTSIALQEALKTTENGSGNFDFELKFDPHNSNFIYNLKASPFVCGDYRFEKCLLSGKKKGSRFSIEQLQLDRLSIAADILKEKDRYLFDFLGIRWDHSILAGLEGEYSTDTNAFNGRINLLEIDLTSLNKPLQEGVLKSHFKGTGQVHIAPSRENSGWYVDALLNSPNFAKSPFHISLTSDSVAPVSGTLSIFEQSLENRGKGYRLDGKWQLDNLSKNEANRDPFTFQGNITGENIEFKGYQFETLEAKAGYRNGQVLLSNVFLKDSAINVETNQVLITRPNSNINSWKMSIEKLIVKQFQPALLTEIEASASPSISPSLIIPQMEIRNLNGFIGNPKSFRAAGSFYFTNKQKRMAHNPILAIPSKILGSAGLDPAVLTPASGQIFFSIHDQRAFFTKFKDLYSYGKRSKFTLSKIASSIDFDGNLDIHIRMKQHNLLFKLAELFTVNIGGTIQRPIYSLQKQFKKK